MIATLINIEPIKDRSGNISVIDNNAFPFPVVRVFWLYDIPGGSARGGHAHKQLHQFIIAVVGSFDIILDNGCNKEKHTLNRSSISLHIKPGTWAELSNFSSGAICLVLCSDIYKESDYIRDYQAFLNYKTHD